MCLRIIALVLALPACSVHSNGDTPKDHGELFWAAKVNVDPVRVAGAEPLAWVRPAIELEVGGVRGTVAPNQILHDYDVETRTLSFAPEILVQDWLSVTPQLGWGQHEVEATLEMFTGFGRMPYVRGDDGDGHVMAIDVTIKPLPWLRVFGRVGTYDGNVFEQEFVETGVKVGYDFGWVFAAWRSAELDFAAPAHSGTNPRFGGDVEVNGLLIGTELRF